MGKEKCSAMLAAKNVTQRAANVSLRELRDTVMLTAKADPFEDAIATKDALGEDYEGVNEGTTLESFAGAKSSAPAAQTYPNFLPGGPTEFTQYEDNPRLQNA